MKGLRELYPSMQLVFSFDFAEASVCFVGFLSGKSAVSVATLIKARAKDEVAIAVREEELALLTMTLGLCWLSYSFQRGEDWKWESHLMWCT